MTFPPELTVAERPAYLRALNTHALQRIDFHLLTLDHALISSLHPLALDGQVNYNNTNGLDGTVARTLQAGFLDPDHSLNLDSDAPTDGMGGLHRLLRVRHSVWVDELDKWATTEIFTGQPMVPKRDGDTITLECHDKSARHLRFAPPTTIRKGTPWITAIKQGLRAAGEHHFRFPAAAGAKVGRNIAVGGADEKNQPWKVWQRLAKSYGYHLFYDGSGYAVLRKIPSGTPVITWDMTGESVNVLGPLSYAADHTKIRNRSVVTSKRKVGNRNVSLSAAAQTPSGLYSPAVLAAGDVPWTNTDYFSNDALTRRASLLNVARQRLKANTTQAVTLSVPVLPVYHLDPRDMCRVVTPTSSVDFSLGEASVPLFDDGASGMTVGSQKNVRSVASGRIGRLS